MLFLARAGRWNGPGKQNLGLMPDLQLFEQAATSGQTSNARKVVFDNRWIGSVAGVPNRLHGWHSGVSILRVDRLKGVSGSLDALNLGISVKLCPTSSPNISVREGMNERIWVVDITATRGRDPEQDMSDTNADIRGEAFCACICCCFDPPRSIIYQRYEADHLVKVLDASDLK